MNFINNINKTHVLLTTHVQRWIMIPHVRTQAVSFFFAPPELFHDLPGPKVLCEETEFSTVVTRMVSVPSPQRMNRTEGGSDIILR